MLKRDIKLKIMKKLFLLITISLVLFSCKEEQLYTLEQCSDLQKGDTIYTHEFYSYEKCIVLKNSPEKELIEVQNVNYSFESILSYDDFRFK